MAQSQIDYTNQIMTFFKTPVVCTLKDLFGTYSIWFHSCVRNSFFILKYFTMPQYSAKTRRKIERTLMMFFRIKIKLNTQIFFMSFRLPETTHSAKVNNDFKIKINILVLFLCLERFLSRRNKICVKNFLLSQHYFW